MGRVDERDMDMEEGGSKDGICRCEKVVGDFWVWGCRWKWSTRPGGQTDERGAACIGEYYIDDVMKYCSAYYIVFFLCCLLFIEFHF